MTPSDFKAWFEGFTEALSGTPTKAQWVRIKERVSEIDGRPITEKIYLDRYWPSYVYFVGSQQSRFEGFPVYYSNTNGVFNTTAAMYSLGKAEAVTT